MSIFIEQNLIPPSAQHISHLQFPFPNCCWDHHTCFYHMQTTATLFSMASPNPSSSNCRSKILLRVSLLTPLIVSTPIPRCIPRTISHWPFSRSSLHGLASYRPLTSLYPPPPHGIPAPATRTFLSVSSQPLFSGRGHSVLLCCPHSLKLPCKDICAVESLPLYKKKYGDCSVKLLPMQTL